MIENLILSNHLTTAELKTEKLKKLGAIYPRDMTPRDGVLICGKQPNFYQMLKKQYFFTRSLMICMSICYKNDEIKVEIT